ncbi:MAG: 50S ribosomal protein L1 [Candidatus Undinarchaeales archaeon]
MKKEDIKKAVKKAKEKAKDRNFTQTFELAVSLKNIDIKKEDKIKFELNLPNPTGKDKKFAAFAEGVLAENAKEAGIKKIINKSQLAKFGSEKKKFKKILSDIDMFIAQPDMMVDIGKNLGPILAPRGMMPKPVPPKTDLKAMLSRFNKVININVKSPSVNCRIGTEKMDEEKIAENAKEIIDNLVEKLPKHEHQLKAAYLKLTMGPSIEIGAVEEEK